MKYRLDFTLWSVCFESSVFHSDSLKHKVTVGKVGKDTLNINQAVCCSEVGQIDPVTDCNQDYPNELNHRQSSVPITHHLLV